MKSEDQDPTNEKNDFEKELDEIREWQDNQFNPGHYIGTGRVPRPLSSLSKHPVILIILGVIWLVPGILALCFSGISMLNLTGLIFGLIFPMLFIYGGVVRLRSGRKSRRK
jgi:hypothetical protein